MKVRRVAFAGASGTGKSTLAEWMKKTYALPINPIGGRGVARDMGFASAYELEAAGKGPEFRARLTREKVAWEAEQDDFVTDRTTFDNIAYAMLHGATSVTDATFDLACQGIARYEYIVYCPVAVFIDLGNDPARLSSMTYQKLFDAALWGLLQKFRVPETRLVTMPFPGLEHRKDFLRALMKPI